MKTVNFEYQVKTFNSSQVICVQHHVVYYQQEHPHQLHNAIQIILSISPCLLQHQPQNKFQYVHIYIYSFAYLIVYTYNISIKPQKKVHPNKIPFNKKNPPIPIMFCWSHPSLHLNPPPPSRCFFGGTSLDPGADRDRPSGPNAVWVATSAPTFVSSADTASPGSSSWRSRISRKTCKRLMKVGQEGFGGWGFVGVYIT